MENKINAMIEIGSGSITTKTVLKITGMIERKEIGKLMLLLFFSDMVKNPRSIVFSVWLISTMTR